MKKTTTIINLELKHYCADFSKIRKVLLELGAVKDRVVKQKDYYFVLPEEKSKNRARLKLRVEGGVMYLVYYERPDFIFGKDTTSDGGYLVVEKEMLNFLKRSLGVIAVIEKKREVWKKKNTVFHLDEVKDVGGIFEIELQKRGKINEKDRKEFSIYQNKVLPYLGPVVNGSNIDLVKKTQNK
ncbi:MAG: CYTH domain-containing protein [Candidatus Nomurabacteria bacterium]|nr:MAG: CYTH domain-containing protein [Candidatus Nomurabacteria bacterium]